MLLDFILWDYFKDLATMLHGPLKYRQHEYLSILEQETLVLNCLLKLTANFPTLPNISNGILF